MIFAHPCGWCQTTECRDGQLRQEADSRCAAFTSEERNPWATSNSLFKTCDSANQQLPKFGILGNMRLSAQGLLLRASFQQQYLMLFAIIFLFSVISTTVASTTTVPVCDKSRYGNPASTDCIIALFQFPQDRTVRFFVEEQMRTQPPEASYNGFRDARPRTLRENVVQMPKWVSRGMYAFGFFF